MAQDLRSINDVEQEIHLDGTYIDSFFGGEDTLSFLYGNLPLPPVCQNQTAITIPCISFASQQQQQQQQQQPSFIYENQFQPTLYQPQVQQQQPQQHSLMYEEQIQTTTLLQPPPQPPTNNLVNNNTASKRRPPFSYIEKNSKTLPEIPQPIFTIPDDYVTELNEFLKKWFIPDLTKMGWYFSLLPPQLQIPYPITKEFATIWRNERESAQHLAHYEMKENKLSSMCFTLVQGKVFPVGLLKKGTHTKGSGFSIKRIDIDYFVQEEENIEYSLCSRLFDLLYDGPLFTFEDLTKIECALTQSVDQSVLNRLTNVFLIMQQPLKEEDFVSLNFPSFVYFLKSFSTFNELSRIQFQKQYSVQQSFELWSILFKDCCFAWEADQKNHFMEVKSAHDERVLKHLGSLSKEEIFALANLEMQFETELEHEHEPERETGKRKRGRKKGSTKKKSPDTLSDLLYNFIVPVALKSTDDTNPFSRQTELNDYTDNMFKKLMCIRQNYKNSYTPTVFDLLLFRLDFTKAFMKWLRESMNRITHDLGLVLHEFFKQQNCISNTNDSLNETTDSSLMNNETPSSLVDPPSLPSSTQPQPQPPPYFKHTLPNLSLSRPTKKQKTSKQKILEDSKRRSRQRLLPRVGLILPIPPPTSFTKNDRASSIHVVPLLQQQTTPPPPPPPPLSSHIENNLAWVDDFADWDLDSLTLPEPTPPPTTTTTTTTITTTTNNNDQPKEGIMPPGVRSGTHFTLPIVTPKQKTIRSFPKTR